MNMFWQHHQKSRKLISLDCILDQVYAVIKQYSKLGYQGNFKPLCFFMRKFYIHKKHKKHKKHKTSNKQYSSSQMFFMSIKNTKSIKSTKRIQATFFFLDVFMCIKSTKSIKSSKSIKITKTLINEQVTFLTLDIFYEHKNAAFFVFVRLYAFLYFLCLKFSHKKTKRFKITLISSFTILLTFTPFSLPQVICTHLFVFMIICQNLSLL